MAGLFGFHMEDAEGRVIDERGDGMDESETSTAAIEELRQEEAEIIERDGEAEALDDNVELAEDITEEVEPVVTEGRGLDKVSMGLVLATMRKIAGRSRKHLVGRNIKMESIDAGPAGRLEQSKLVLEDLKDTLKQAWEAIKSAFKKAWAKVKTWYIKTFDASKKLKARAEKIRNKAESGPATIDKKTFSFSAAKSISIGGSVKDAGKFVSAVDSVKALSDKVLSVVKVSEIDNASDALAKAIGDEVKESELSKAADYFLGAGKSLIEVSGGTLEEAVKKSFGPSSEVSVAASTELPGGKAVVRVVGASPKGNDVGAKIAAIRRSRNAFTNVKDKPKEVSGEAQTLSASQVSKVCDAIIDIAENIFDFKKGWENRDKSQDKVIKDIDAAFREITKGTDEDEASSAGRRNARGLASAATGALRRDSSFKASFVSYAMSLGSVALSYCEGSMRQYK